MLTRWTIRCGAWLSGRVRAIVYCVEAAAHQHEALGFNPRLRLPVGILLRCDLPRGFPCFGFLFRGLQAFRCLLLNLLCGALAQGHLGGGRGC